ncbi:DUF302 domain-containing protein [Shewanella yunxiaonensis]|uniref:DUF302 domain-containing protein n=1 Tax=Shewanella yunxiaonensis TaxID=2829809 RepID=A0ABX7YYN0_9GAMM|nr:DUF302 domain-containing protein [Shewanella yunxiaonensis]QUN07415.1 DUF302 domain-containing protein [Shewanella yunxiaonensis]
MYTIVESTKSFDVTANALEESVKKNGFGVLHIHNLGATLRSKGIDYAEECKVFEVCNPQQASKVLAIDVRLNMALPCRISVYTEGGKVKVGYIKPVEMLSALSNDAALVNIAREVESAMINILNAAIA